MFHYLAADAARTESARLRRTASGPEALMAHELRLTRSPRRPARRRR
jgi:hypothetical protein